MTGRSSVPVYPLVIESFSDPRFFVNASRTDAPDCFNGSVSIDRYRITIEKIEEPDVLRERLRKLWCEKEYNSHDTLPMKAKAVELGIQLDADERAIGYRARDAKEKP